MNLIEKQNLPIPRKVHQITDDIILEDAELADEDDTIIIEMKQHNNWLICDDDDKCCNYNRTHGVVKLKCSYCKIVYYCNKNCQSKD